MCLAVLVGLAMGRGERRVRQIGGFGGLGYGTASQGLSSGLQGICKSSQTILSECN